MKWSELNQKAEGLYERLFGKGSELSEDRYLEELAGRMEDPHYLRHKWEEQDSYDYEKAFRRLMNLHRRVLLKKYGRLAALFLLPLGLGLVFFFALNRSQEGGTAASGLSEITWVDIKPGEHKAFLKMHDGREMKLTHDSALYEERNGARIKIDTAGIHYDVSEVEKEASVIYNTLVVPRGGEYFLTLADGSKVWLNADSELKYPVNFQKDARRVAVKGEAYFEVKKAGEWPFIVETGLGQIWVLGTEFNVRNYEGSDKWVTTLVKGRIACKLEEGGELILQPDQQLIAAKGGKVKIREVDTRFSVGWKEGMFLFRNERLEDIMEQLSRWYDVGVFYTCEPVKNLHFSGDLSRYKSIDTFIEMFGKSSDAKFSLNGKTLIIGL